MPLTDDEANMLREISGRIRAEAVAILLTSARDRMVKAGVRRQVINEVLQGMTRDAETQFATLDDETIRTAFDDLAQEGDQP